MVASLKRIKTSPSTDKRVPQIIKDYTTLTEQFQNLIQKIEEGPTPPPPPPPPPMPWWKNPKILGFAGGALIVVITLISIIVVNHNKQKEKEKATQEEQVQIIADVRNYINAKDFQKAKKMVWKIDEPLCTQLADSIIFCELDDITVKRGFRDFTSTWKKYNGEFSGEYPEIKQMAIDTIANRRWRYIDNLVTKAERATTNASKTSAKETAENAIKIGEGTELHSNDKAQEYYYRLNKIQFVVENSNGSSPGSGRSQTTTQYRVVVCKANNGLRSCMGEPYTFVADGTISGTNFVYHLEYLNKSNQWNGIAADIIKTSNDDQLKINVPAFGTDYYGIKLANDEGTITISKGKFKCKITIKKQ